MIYHVILVYIRRVNPEEHGTKVETVRYSPVSLVGYRTVHKVCTVQFKVYSIQSTEIIKNIHFPFRFFFFFFLLIIQSH